MTELRNALKASGLTLDELADATGVHATTLSRATNGLHLRPDQERRVRAALRAALRKAEANAARERAKLAPSKAATAAATK
jgi:transcriptional regulator with XRE-family HTH domain